MANESVSNRAPSTEAPRMVHCLQLGSIAMGVAFCDTPIDLPTYRNELIRILPAAVRAVVATARANGSEAQQEVFDALSGVELIACLASALNDEINGQCAATPRPANSAHP